MNEPITLLVCDDHPVVRQGLRTFLELQEEFEVVGEAENGEEAAAKVADLLPDVVLLDLVMPEADGLGAIRRIRDVSPSTRVVVLTSFVEDEQVFEAVKAGAAGYLLKDVEPAELANAIRTVHRGEAQLHPAAAAKLMQEFAADRPSAAAELTDRELDVLRLIAQGLSNKVIARELGVSEKTVKTHVGNILAKLHLADRTQAALFAVRQRIVE